MLGKKLNFCTLVHFVRSELVCRIRLSLFGFSRGHQKGVHPAWGASSYFLGQAQFKNKSVKKFYFKAVASRYQQKSRHRRVLYLYLRQLFFVTIILNHQSLKRTSVFSFVVLFKEFKPSLIFQTTSLSKCPLWN